MLFRHKGPTQKKFYVDLGDLQNEKENLTSFLQSNLKVTVSQDGIKLKVESENAQLQELLHAVNKFVYRRKLNLTHWVTVEGSTVKIVRFKGSSKKEKYKKERPHQTATQSWGL